MQKIENFRKNALGNVGVIYNTYVCSYRSGFMAERTKIHSTKSREFAGMGNGLRSVSELISYTNALHCSTV